MKLLSVKTFNPGDKKESTAESNIKDIDFNIFKLNNRPKPTDKSQILIIGCFSEFGCETVGAMYCIPKIMKENRGKYIIVVGWHGREYLYRHLVDEFWEIKEEYMWLREYARAFHNESKNIKLIEKKLTNFGSVLTSDYLGKIAVGVTCKACGAFWGDVRKIKNCIKCKSTDIKQSLFGDVVTHKKDVVRIPSPSVEKLEQARQYLGTNPVGVFARQRKCYGRNLQPEFYVGLVKLLEDKGYTPIWLGEKQSTMACPVDHIVDFSRMAEARDLELTLAIVKQLKFTVQFWTASTRLAAMMGTPYIIFETPDQIWGNGQEGYRLNLCDFSPKKLVISHYLNVYNDNEAGLKLLGQCINEVEQNNFDDVFGLLESDIAAQDMKRDNASRIGS
jgi:predicted Zn-ribbon and HTH transcriptional regulator